MSASVLLTLDTHAPVVTWGAPSNANAGEELTIPFALNEPSLTRAEIALPDARVLDMVALGGVLSVVLPDDAPDGEAQVRAYVEDDVGNAATRTLAVALNGSVGPPPPPPQQGPGWGAAPKSRPVLVTGRSRGTCSSRTRVRVGVASRSRARTRSRYIAPSQRIVRRASRATAASSARLAVTSHAHAAAVVGASRATLWKRPEGPGTEEELMVLLGLL